MRKGYWDRGPIGKRYLGGYLRGASDIKTGKMSVEMRIRNGVNYANIYGSIPATAVFVYAALTGGATIQ